MIQSSESDSKKYSQSRQTQIKICTETKAKGIGKKTAAPAKRPVRPILQLEWDAVEANQRPFGDQLPEILPLDLEQDNIPLDPPNQHQDLSVGGENQQHYAEDPNQVPNLPPEPEELDQLEQPNLPPNQPNQPNEPPNPVQNLPAALVHLQQLNWSYFKPEFSGKLEEDAEEHLLRTNYWMETHDFPHDQMVRRFCLTLMGEARLWYETLGAAQLDCKTLRDC